MPLLEKDIAIPLPQQLYVILRDRITSGRYQAGRKLESVRALSEKYNVSTLVVNQAIRLLERDQLVVRMPARGIYVSTRDDLKKKLLRVILVFPEVAISPDALNLSNWYFNTEIYNGMLQAALPENVTVHFQYFPEARDDFELREQLQQLDGYDAAVFWGEQRHNLRLLAKERVPILVHLLLGHFNGTGESLALTFSQEESVRKLADFVVGRSYRNHACLSFATDMAADFYRWRADFFLAEMAARGFPVPPALDATVHAGDDAAIAEELAAFLRRERPEFIFVNYSDKLALVFDALLKAGLRPGHDTDLVFIGPRGVFPACTCVSPPYHEMGRTAIEKIIAIGSGREPFVPGTIELPSRTHLGASTRKDDKTAAPLAAVGS